MPIKRKFEQCRQILLCFRSHETLFFFFFIYTNSVQIYLNISVSMSNNVRNSKSRNAYYNFLPFLSALRCRLLISTYANTAQIFGRTLNLNAKYGYDNYRYYCVANATQYPS